MKIAATVKILLIILIILMSGNMLQCFGTPKKSPSTIRDSINQTVIKDSVTPNDSSNRFAPNDSGLYIGIVSKELLLLPIAHQLPDSSWHDPWTQSWEEGQGRSSMKDDVPQRWTIYAIKQTVPPETGTAIERRVVEFGCQSNWTIVLRSGKESDENETSFGIEHAIAFSQPVTVLTNEEIIVLHSRIEKAKQELKYIDNPLDNEMRKTYSNMLYFRWQDALFGIIMHRGYENINYILIQIRDNTSSELLSAQGGGC